MMAAHGAVVRGRLGRKGEDMLFLLLIKKFWVQRNSIIVKLEMVWRTAPARKKRGNSGVGDAMLTLRTLKRGR